MLVTVLREYFFLTMPSPPSSHEEDVQVKRRRIQPTKHIPTKITQSDIRESASQYVMTGAAR